MEKELSQKEKEMKKPNKITYCMCSVCKYNITEIRKGKPLLCKNRRLLCYI